MSDNSKSIRVRGFAVVYLSIVLVQLQYVNILQLKHQLVHSLFLLPSLFSILFSFVEVTGLLELSALLSTVFDILSTIYIYAKTFRV